VSLEVSDLFLESSNAFVQRREQIGLPL
jgi:hypothetical protein